MKVSTMTEPTLAVRLAVAELARTQSDEQLCAMVARTFGLRMDVAKFRVTFERELGRRVPDVNPTPAMKSDVRNIAPAVTDPDVIAFLKKKYGVELSMAQLHLLFGTELVERELVRAEMLDQLINLANIEGHKHQVRAAIAVLAVMQRQAMGVPINSDASPDAQEMHDHAGKATSRRRDTENLASVKGKKAQRRVAAANAPNGTDWEGIVAGKSDIAAPLDADDDTDDGDDFSKNTKSALDLVGVDSELEYA